MKIRLCTILIASVISSLSVSVAQTLLSGRISTTGGEALAGVSVRIQSTGQVIPVDASGNFRLQPPVKSDTLLVNHLGYLSQKVTIGPTNKKMLIIQLVPDANTLQEVEVSTGYYSVPKERATGSFTHIDTELLNRSVSTNILDRLEGVTSGLLFDRRNLTGENVNGAPELRVRGLSTIEASSAPLIVVDNFPYEGDISSINPNDVSDVTILKDAAAASIWGARAGNGVIVITTKQGHYNQPAQVSFNSNVNITNKPDLFYSQSYLPSATVMDIQKELFNRGAYAENDQTRIPLYAELLIKRRDGLINDADFSKQETIFQQNDIRRDWQNDLYQPAITQQYFASVQGGGGNYNYSLSAGYDKDRANLVGNDQSRINLGVQNNFKVNRKLEVGSSVWYASQQGHNNGLGYSSRGILSGQGIYESLKDLIGNPNAINNQNYRYAYQEQAAANGLLDWMYRPLDEVRLADNTSRSTDLRLNTGIHYRFLPGMDVQASYQYTLNSSGSQKIFDKESYEVRNLVNEFTDLNGNRVIPYGGILEIGVPSESYSHSGRVQLNYNRTFSTDHQLSALAGAEIRQFTITSSSGMRQYNYNPDTWTSTDYLDFSTYYTTRPGGFMMIPSDIISPDKTVNRNLSYFGNASYGYNERYILSGSLRWDGSNLLGVKTNQRGTALWSLGGSWELSKEPFYRVDMLPYLRLRSTYGSEGNIDKTQSYYPTIYSGTDGLTGLPISGLTSPGNPSLQWEQVNTLNFGMDWATPNRRVSGSFEYYLKNASHLLGNTMMDPTTGIPTGSSYKLNYGDLRTTGWDAEINSRNLTGLFSWESTLIVSGSQNKITEYNGPLQDYATNYFFYSIPEQGKSVDILYALPWNGLSPQDGLPLIYQNGQETRDYQDYLLNFPSSELVNAGTLVPTIFGSLRNSLQYKGFEINFLISFKLGHVFRRSSIASGEEYNTSSPVYHMDYFKRWQKAGDEKFTQVPARTTDQDLSGSAYLYSEALVTKGDVIRLQDVGINYTLNNKWIRNMRLQNVRLYGYARNLGIVWRANKNGLDPDYPHADYPAPMNLALGLQVGF